ncbi:ChrR family anti-sigma-E factor [Colwellia echini]|uniref:Transcriptional regulator n=1 Tax=Colwellia echini TaxID=1982103 RepID=A0ABY3MYF1_9GAMM|nr:ChrR family anti-sigma-E factor [Colwellia echini]TYK66209.1 transcriptional regulator [Colwellia echini]
MIKHHPKFELLELFVNGELPASLSAGIAIHAEMCPKCQEKIALLTEQIAAVNFEKELSDPFLITDDIDDFSGEESLGGLNIDDMVANITQAQPSQNTKLTINKSVTYQGKSYALPRALANMEVGKAANIGKLSRSRIQLNENEVRTSLLHIAPGGGVPEHTHKGFELTLLLEGTFSDEDGEYIKGDFIMLDSSHQHHPISKNGCLCYTVANGALHFTQGINKLLNPIGAFIY